MKRTGILLGMAIVVGMVCTNAAERTLKVTEKEPPKEVGEAIGKLLKPEVIQVLEGEEPIHEFWLRNEVPLKTKPSSAVKALEALPEMTIIGVVKVGAGLRDYKDSAITPGTYTLRYSLQPQDGDHLGTTDFLYFAVLAPAKGDTEPGSIKTYKALMRASAKTTDTGHPGVLSMRPSAGEIGAKAALTEPAPDHQAIRVALAGTVADGEKAALPFELVFEGKYQH